MIAFLKGVVEETGPDSIVVSVGGVGYRCHATPSTISKLSESTAGGEVKVFTHLHVREDALTLYGFASAEECRLFGVLIGVSGVGPKVALSILSHVSPDDFYKAVLYEQPDALTRIPGVGAKTAQRLILELKDRIGVSKRKQAAEGRRAPSNLSIEVQAEEALLALGYSRQEASEAIAAAIKTSPPGATVEDLVMKGLKSLARI